MAEASEKQIITLKRFAKNPKLSQGILKGISFDNLDSKQASDLIKQCIANTNRNGNEEAEATEFVIKYSQNYKNGNGAFATTTLSDEELESVRQAHREHCAERMAECQEDYPDNKEMQVAMFNLRCDKVFTWIQQALEEKVRQARK